MNRTRFSFPFSFSYRFFLLTLLLLSSLFLVACGEGGSKETEEIESEKNPPGAQSPIQVTDAYGGTITLQQPAGKIISLAPNMTEIIAFLGGLDRLVGRTDFCDYPPEVQSIPSIGTLNSYNYERIVRLKPDVTLMSTFDGSSRKEYDKLSSLGAYPFALDGQSIDGTISMIDTVAMLLGVRERGAHRTDSLRRIVDSIRTLATANKPVRTFIVLNKTPLITVARGFIDEMLRGGGGENIAAGDPIAYPEFSRELLVRRNPEVILVPADSKEIIGELLEAYPEWREITAVKEGRIYTIPQNIIARPGPRIVEGLAEIYRLLHGAVPAP